ncbi:hypothetical protein RhiirA4_484270 [Rhizophagus irregularis]|uniref:Uncharacterized protein n=1 Tax=Rhizophagus irregularis TaxID=588596 RepID=A0A2I1HNP6_9GLOM|nr:hypothetical protein RhiirA4_484270 [Rhizophagus irregularis]
MSGKTKPSHFIKEVHSQIADTMSEFFFDGAETALTTFIENGFLQTMFSKSSDEALRLFDLDDSDDSAKNCDTDSIIENTPITSTPNPVLISQHELPNVEMTPVDQSVIPEISRKK